MDSVIKPIPLRPSIIIFAAVQVFTGLNYGFISIAPKRFRTLLKFFSVVFSIIMIGIMFIDFNVDDAESYSFVLGLIEYCSFSSILFFSKYTFYDFIVDFSNIDSYVSVKEIIFETVNKALYYPMLSLLIQSLIYIPYCYYSVKEKFYCNRPMIVYLVGTITNLAMNSVIIIQFLILQVCYKCLNTLRLRILSCELKADNALKAYKILLDSLDKLKPTFDKMVIASLCIFVPIYMSIIYASLYQLKHSNDWMTFILQYIAVLFLSMLMILIVMAAEMMNVQAEKIKLIFLDRLIEATDTQERFQIKTLLRYMRGRPTQYYVWRRVPLDLRLVGHILSIISTYTIVLIQFTHLYD